MPQHFQDMIKGNVNSSSCSFYKLVAWGNLGQVSLRSMAVEIRALLPESPTSSPGLFS